MDGSLDSIRPEYRGGLAGPQLTRVLHYVDSFLDENLTVDLLAEIAGLSRYHFGRAFKYTTGDTVHSYVLSRRIQRAQELLLRRNSTLVEVAAATGFSSQSHFTTVFKLRLGISPGAYRINHAPGGEEPMALFLSQTKVTGALLPGHLAGKVRRRRSSNPGSE